MLRFDERTLDVFNNCREVCIAKTDNQSDSEKIEWLIGYLR